MTDICPNCSHPLRPGAKYCGFCGTDLTDSPKGKAAVTSAIEDSAMTEGAKSKQRPKTGGRDPFKVISIIAIFLLVAVILSALSVQYWATIYPHLNQLFPALFPR